MWPFLHLCSCKSILSGIIFLFCLKIGAMIAGFIFFRFDNICAPSLKDGLLDPTPYPPIPLRVRGGVLAPGPRRIAFPEDDDWPGVWPLGASCHLTEFGGFSWLGDGVSPFNSSSNSPLGEYISCKSMSRTQMWPFAVFLKSSFE